MFSCFSISEHIKFCKGINKIVIDENYHIILLFELIEFRLFDHTFNMLKSIIKRNTLSVEEKYCFLSLSSTIDGRNLKICMKIYWLSL